MMTRKEFREAVLNTSIVFEQVYIPASMEVTFMPNGQRLLTAKEFNAVKTIRGKLADLLVKLGGAS